MQTNFKKVVISADRKTLTACGDLIWEDGDDRCEIHVDLSQNNATVKGSDDTGSYGTNERTWNCVVSVSTPHNGLWDPNLSVHCVGKATPPTSVPWPPQDLMPGSCQAQAA